MTGDIWSEFPGFSARDRAAISWAESVTLNIDFAGSEARSEAMSHFSRDKLVELTTAICQYAFLNRFNDSLWMELEERKNPKKTLVIEPEEFEAYTKTMYASKHQLNR